MKQRFLDERGRITCSACHIRVRELDEFSKGLYVELRAHPRDGPWRVKLKAFGRSPICRAFLGDVEDPAQNSCGNCEHRWEWTPISGTTSGWLRITEHSSRVEGPGLESDPPWSRGQPISTGFSEADRARYAQRSRSRQVQRPVPPATRRSIHVPRPAYPKTEVMLRRWRPTVFGLPAPMERRWETDWDGEGKSSERLQDLVDSDTFSGAVVLASPPGSSQHPGVKRLAPWTERLETIEAEHARFDVAWVGGPRFEPACIVELEELLRDGGVSLHLATCVVAFSRSRFLELFR